MNAGGSGGTGDPTEVAILAAALDRGIRREQIEAERPRRAVEPFDPETRRMSVLRADGLLYVKGAFESIQPLCRGGTDGAAQANVEMAERGLRVVAVGLGEGPEMKTCVSLVCSVSPIRRGPRPWTQSPPPAAPAFGP